LFAEQLEVLSRPLAAKRFVVASIEDGAQILSQAFEVLDRPMGPFEAGLEAVGREGRVEVREDAAEVQAPCACLPDLRLSRL
jgi:hypothetical protein